LVGDLNTLPDLVKNNNVRAPTLIVVGEVVNLHSQLNWFKPSNKIQ
jgi:uroporphyrin-III C-methyltransferase/precorrin-2 dehydrogenase/sirohydrochlorin ferrochelatase